MRTETRQSSGSGTTLATSCAIRERVLGRMTRALTVAVVCLAVVASLALLHRLAS